jgi:BCD family chlorophyll transporter-like MFS transporter
VQTALGAVVVLTTSAINRGDGGGAGPGGVLCPGCSSASITPCRFMRPRMGTARTSAAGRTPWIVGGTAVLALGGTGAAVSVAVIEAAVFARASPSPCWRSC